VQLHRAVTFENLTITQPVGKKKVKEEEKKEELCR
jgi:hypothetical protein